MGRLIEFRSWDDTTDGYGPKGMSYGVRHDCDATAIMQSTGIRDCNGAQIYEGDVVKTPNGDWGVIQYEAPFFGVTVSDISVSQYRRDWMESCEVIGNIYEHPELLR